MSDLPVDDYHDRALDALAKTDEATKLRFKQLMRESPANFDFYGAVLEAKKGAELDEIIAYPSKNLEMKYTVQQGLRAACHGREDTATVMIVQLAILKRLDKAEKLNNRVYFCMCAVVVLLLYIASKLS